MIYFFFKDPMDYPFFLCWEAENFLNNTIAKGSLWKFGTAIPLNGSEALHCPVAILRRLFGNPTVLTAEEAEYYQQPRFAVAPHYAQYLLQQMIYSRQIKVLVDHLIVLFTSKNILKLRIILANSFRMIINNQLASQGSFLHLACSTGNVEIVQLTLSQLCPDEVMFILQLQDVENSLPLHCAVKTGNLAIIRLIKFIMEQNNIKIDDAIDQEIARMLIEEQEKNVKHNSVPTLITLPPPMPNYDEINPRSVETTLPMGRQEEVTATHQFSLPHLVPSPAIPSSFTAENRRKEPRAGFSIPAARQDLNVRYSPSTEQPANKRRRRNTHKISSPKAADTSKSTERFNGSPENLLKSKSKSSSKCVPIFPRNPDKTTARENNKIQYTSFFQYNPLTKSDTLSNIQEDKSDIFLDPSVIFVNRVRELEAKLLSDATLIQPHKPGHSTR